jgi:gluconokinase
LFTIGVAGERGVLEEARKITKIQECGVIIVVMGVTGAGKTTVGRLLARELEWDFVDADNFHPESNVEKMRAGIPLNEDDRRPWLERLRAEIARYEADRRDLVMACSALKNDYRKMLGVGPGIKFVYLKGSVGLIAERLRGRRGHFAGEGILAGQFADLEEPDAAVEADIGGSPEEIVKKVREKLGI